MVEKKRILLIEDEEDIASLIKLQAELEGFKLHVEVDGINGYRAIERERPDLVILDVMLPGLNGFDVCRRIRNNPELRNTLVVFLTAKGDELDIVLGLELGADDYIPKPFSPKVLFSRIKAILRRKSEPEKNHKVIQFGEYTLDIDRYLLKRENETVSITLSEFGILRRLLGNRGQVLSRSQLLTDINNDDAFVVDRNIDVHIASLRKKLGPKFNWIETVRGVGYRFKEEEAAQKVG
ncbi:MAG: response regulator transcription factor [Candidatus Algichlamydia australiensis]|nr:response regulator transcription factor [Chlamydiales bacterium]